MSILQNILGYKPSREAHILFNKIAKLVKKFGAEIQTYHIDKKENRYSIEVIIKKRISNELEKPLKDINRKFL